VDTRVSQLEFAGFRLDRLRRQLCDRDGATVRLNSRALEALLVFVEKPGRVLSKRELMQAIWQNVVVEENNLTQAISALRKALGDTQDPPQIIQTVPGRGYCFIATLREVPDEVATQKPATVANRDNGAWRRHVVITLAVTMAALTGAWLWSQRPAADTHPDAASRTISGTRAGSVAVLPFASSGDGSDERSFVAGLHDEVITRLTRVQGLRVITRSAVMRYRDDSRAATEIARDLNVGAVLEGTVRSAGPQMRINLQLSDTGNRVSLWSASYEVSLDDPRSLFKLQTDIAENVAKALSVKLATQAGPPAIEIPTQSPVAYQHYLKALGAIAGNDFVGAVADLEKAVSADPAFADAWRRLAINQNIITATPVTTPAQHHARALFAARKAVSLAPGSANAHYSLGNVLYAEGKWEEAGSEFALARSLEHTPHSVIDMQVRGQQVMMLMAIGDFDGALRIQQQELAQSPMQLVVRGLAVVVHEVRGDHQQALREYAEGKALLPGWWGNNPGVWIALGQHDTEHLEKAARDFPDYVLRNVLVLHADRSAAITELRRMHGAMMTLTPAQQLNAAMFSAYYAQTDMAMDFLQSALRSNGASFYTIWLPVFAELRQTERFRSLLRGAGLVDYWQRHGWPKDCAPAGADFSCR
jgi:TolB-like protein/DNA-binding winged helix-turn-helix (wHTH) protein/Flp pilus assembly protein TadD